jgi:hypothetical protein
MPTQILTAGSIFPFEYRKAVSTRPSGLIEYSVTYLVEKNTGAGNLTVGTSIGFSGQSGKIAYPPRITSSNGSLFDEVEVVAYGLGSAANNLQIGSETIEISKTRGEAPDDYTVYETWVCDVAIKTDVVSGTSQLPSSPSVTLNKTLIRRWHLGKGGNFAILPIQVNWNTGIKNVTRVIYGDYSEVTLSFGYFPEPL